MMNEQNAQAYDQIATQFDLARTDFREKKVVDLLLAQIEPGSRVLDLGCGTGRPIARYLVDREYIVTGVDHSAGMLALAKQYVPEAQFIQADMLSFKPDYLFAAVIAWDSIFHLPRIHHGDLFQKIAPWLQPKGYFLLSLGGSPGKLFQTCLDRPSFTAVMPLRKISNCLEQAGFQILLSEVDDPSSLGHIALLARLVN